GRDRELRRLFGRILTGQSIAIIGDPHIGKTSLLMYLFDNESRKSKIGNRLDHNFFSYLDAQTLNEVQTQAEFWLRALNPLQNELQNESENRLSRVAERYELAKNNNFGTFVLEKLFEELTKAGSRLILLLDEFDDFLTHPVLNSAEFYGGLRSFASRYPSAFSLVLAARKNLAQLNNLTQEINPITQKIDPLGSPYFNVFTEIRLNAWLKKVLPKLIDKSYGYFNSQDAEYIYKVSGLHPYLAQMAAGTLFDAHLDGHIGAERYKKAAQELYEQSQHHFEDCWRSWTNESKKAITAVALNQIPRMVPNHNFLVSELTKNLDDFTPELVNLEKVGLLELDQDGTWIIKQQAFVWWLTDELRRHVRDNSEFETWLQSQELDGMLKMLTKQEKEVIGNTISEALSTLGKGAMTLIEEMAKAFGEGAANALLPSD
ncbi:MAG: ATP-binding protein, partial [Cyanobacteria bacterium P01_F01_bin.143]